MSALDNAFIRAYQLEGGPRPPAPAGSDVPLPASVEMRADAASQPADRPYFGAPTGAAHFVSTEAPPQSPGGHSRPGAQGPHEGSIRRPLSSFAPPPPVEASFQPALEVDRFRWSEVAEELTGPCRAAWQGALEAIDHSLEAGGTVIGVAGTSRGAGCTTSLICVGRLLARQGRRGVWVDGDFSCPGLADALGVGVEVGWEDVLAGRMALAEVVINSLEDRVAVTPLVHGGEPAAEKLDTLHSSVTAGILRYHYDVVLIDLGPLDVARQAATAQRIARQCRLDAVLLVGDDRGKGGTGLAQLDELAPELSGLYLGDIVNRASH